MAIRHADPFPDSYLEVVIVVQDEVTDFVGTWCLFSACVGLNQTHLKKFSSCQKVTFIRSFHPTERPFLYEVLTKPPYTHCVEEVTVITKTLQIFPNVYL